MNKEWEWERECERFNNKYNTLINKLKNTLREKCWGGVGGFESVGSSWGYEVLVGFLWEDCEKHRIYDYFSLIFFLCSMLMLEGISNGNSFKNVKSLCLCAKKGGGGGKWNKKINKWKRGEGGG